MWNRKHAPRVIWSAIMWNRKHAPRVIWSAIMWNRKHAPRVYKVIVAVDMLATLYGCTLGPLGIG